MSTTYVDAAVCDWVRSTTGISITRDNAAPVELAIRLEAERRRLSPAELVAGVLSGRLPAQSFIDAITTNESYFFRAQKQMEVAVGELLPERLRKQPERDQRLLSIPCARGEEPYSMAILLRERGIADPSVRLMGADISQRCLADARRGEFGALALRRTDAVRAKRWFRAVDARRYRLDPTIVARVQFHRINLLTDDVVALGGPFDILFCQNLLIYFDPATIARALAALRRLLRPDGWLFVDHTEWNLPRAGFQMQERGGCVGFRPSGTPLTDAMGPPPVSRRRAVPKPPPALPARPLTSTALRPEPPSRAATGPARVTDDAFEPPPPTALDAFDAALAQAPLDSAALLGKARVLADGGEELEALECLETLLEALDEGAIQMPLDDRIEALALFGLLLNRKGLGGLAQGYFDELARLAPGHAVLRLRGAGHV
ncbi:hypothetical protein G3480_15000 [Thiorhodococcus mannitoliphagus]|uniref:CheR-type methyltransferase domain-containing protein n=1 Tax=Thiorhodococcus mannitoliphagus TaxID=329406 RepID=A0A6P1DWV3_9GAMM|nr:CheR family methyltransferase [Thiorhodococcus mannitoliphagus]NEX21603.1 hypothetical protein [Thiorhodococcus mannitoliphagus]